jgi:hypothetical protein
MSPTEARLACISGTRALIAHDEFATLTTLLVDCGAVPANVMAGALRGLAESYGRKARGEIETEWILCPAELHERAASLRAMAEELSTGG